MSRMRLPNPDMRPRDTEQVREYQSGTGTIHRPMARLGRMKTSPSSRAIGAGILVGKLIGSAGIAAAGFGWKAWSSLKTDYKLGYVGGFLDMANLARNLQPGGWVDTKYPYLPQVKPYLCAAELDQLY